MASSRLKPVMASRARFIAWSCRFVSRRATPTGMQSITPSTLTRSLGKEEKTMVKISLTLHKIKDNSYSQPSSRIRARSDRIEHSGKKCKQDMAKGEHLRSQAMIGLPFTLYCSPNALRSALSAFPVGRPSPLLPPGRRAVPKHQRFYVRIKPTPESNYCQQNETY